MNIVDKSDEEIMGHANELWRDLIKSSNDGNYGEFIKNFAPSLTMALDLAAGRCLRALRAAFSSFSARRCSYCSSC